MLLPDNTVDNRLGGCLFYLGVSTLCSLLIFAEFTGFLLYIVTIKDDTRPGNNVISIHNLISTYPIYNTPGTSSIITHISSIISSPSIPSSHLNNLPNNSNMRSRKKPRSACVAAPKPIIVDILRLGDIRTARKRQFIFDIVFRIPRPKRMNNQPNPTVRREPRREMRGGRLNGRGW